jgi:hypothetical protein
MMARQTATLEIARAIWSKLYTLRLLCHPDPTA